MIKEIVVRGKVIETDKDVITLEEPNGKTAKFAFSETIRPVLRVLPQGCVISLLLGEYDGFRSMYVAKRVKIEAVYNETLPGEVFRLIAMSCIKGIELAVLDYPCLDITEIKLG